MSRAYYACHLAARSAAFGNCSPAARTKAMISSERRIGHEKLVLYLENSSSSAVKQLGKDLASLYGHRKDADYNMSAVIAAADACDVVENATGFLNDLSQVGPAAVGRAMEDYINQISP